MTGNATPFERIHADLLEKLARVGTQTATGVLTSLGYRNCYLVGDHPPQTRCWRLAAHRLPDGRGHARRIPRVAREPDR
ncbi:MAG: hypothetical protein HYY04_02815 [Chloroflexi bacterium]|nr:hypothetical protein [Chloroflexota bacterium]